MCFCRCFFPVVLLVVVSRLDENKSEWVEKSGSDSTFKDVPMCITCKRSGVVIIASSNRCLQVWICEEMRTSDCKSFVSDAFSLDHFMLIANH